MKKNIAWFAIIPICVVALYCLLISVMNVPEQLGYEPTALALFIPIFFIICFGNIVVHIIAGVLGMVSKNKYISYKDVFYTKEDKIIVKILKILGYMCTLFYLYDMILALFNRDLYSITWNVLAIVVTVFYISWFGTIKFRKNKINIKI